MILIKSYIKCNVVTFAILVPLNSGRTDIRASVFYNWQVKVHHSQKQPWETAENK